MNKKTKNIVIISVSAFLAVALIVVLCCVFLIKKDPYVVDGLGSVEVVENEDGTKSMKATPNKWYEFIGWYEEGEETAYSTSSELKLEDNTPKLTAVFKTSAKQSIDRFLNGLHNKYAEFANGEVSSQAVEDEFLNLDLGFNMGYDTGSKQGNLEFKLGGYLNFQGKDNQISLTIKDVEKNEYVANLYYVDNVNEAKLYVKVGEKEYAYDMPSFSSVLGNLSPASEGTWTLESVISSLMEGQDTSSIMNSINSFLGVNSNLDISADNSGNNAIFSFDISDIINSTLLSLKDTDLTLILGEETGAILNDVLDIVLNDYDNDITNPNPTPYPEFNLNFNASFEEVNGVEYLSGLTVSLNTPESDPKLVLKDSEYTTTVTIDNLTVNADLDASRNAIPTEVMADFEDVDVINILNFHVDGNMYLMDGYSEVGENDVETMVYNPIDSYNIELNVDINQMAILNAVEGNTINLEKIDWNNLGLLSFRIYLDETKTNATNNSNYIDLVLENSKLYLHAEANYPGGATIFIDKIISAVYDMPELVNAIIELTNKEDAQITSNNSVAFASVNENISKEQTIVGSIVSILNRLINQHSVNEILPDLIKAIVGIASKDIAINDLIINNLSYDENFGTVLALGAKGDDNSVTEKLQITVTIDFMGSPVPVTIDLASALFGQNAKFLALDFNNFNYGSISSLGNGNYMNSGDEINFVEDWKLRHPTTIVSIKNIEELNSLTLSESEIINFLINKELSATAILANGDEVTTDVYYQGEDPIQELKVKIFSAKINSIENGKANVTIYVGRYLNSKIMGFIPTFDTIGFDMLGFPTGLYEYNFNVTLTDAVA